MQWDEFIGHQAQREAFATALEKGRLAGTYLFVGPHGIGKETFARLVAKSLLCEQRTQGNLAACGTCESCQQVEAFSHPDIVEVRRQKNKASLAIEDLVGDREHRGREGFCFEIHTRPAYGHRRIGIIHDADHFGIASANSVLKTLEEPPSFATIFLLAVNLQQILPTIRSRCRIMRFSAPTGTEAKQLLERHGAEPRDWEAADAALRYVNGDAVAAAALLAPEQQEFHNKLVRGLEQHPIDAGALRDFVEGYVGTKEEAAIRRDRLRRVIDLSVQHFAARLRQAGREGRLEESDLFRVQRCVEALQQIDRNANQATLIESWAVDLQRGHPASGPVTV